MTKIVSTIDGVRGEVKIVIDDDNSTRNLDFRWCVFDDDGSTGFLTSFAEAPVMVTEVAAEHFIRMVISGLVRAFKIQPGDLTIINHMGERIPDVQFLPPTFKGNEADITMLVMQQNSLLQLHSVYEQSGVLDSDLMECAELEGIVDDFLSLVQVRASGIFLAVNKPSQQGE
jgi:hypothetical protein